MEVKYWTSRLLGVRCSSVVSVFAHSAMGCRIDPSWWTHRAISCSSQCSMTDVTRSMVCVILPVGWEREMFYWTTHSTHFIYGYMASYIWLRTILIVRKEPRCRHIGYSYQLTARVLLYAPSHRQDNTYHGLCYISRGALAGTRNSSMGPPHEGSIHERTLYLWATSRSPCGSSWFLLLLFQWSFTICLMPYKLKCVGFIVK